MKVVIISDTHGHHRSLDTSDWQGDILIHCGDFLNGVNPPASLLEDVDDWFGSLKFKKVLVVGGNHDFEAELRHGFGERVFKNADFLHDRSYYHGNIHFYGSPWVPNLQGWAFYASEADLAKKWKTIPRQVDVLITHTPPFGILDTPHGEQQHLGCPLLAERVQLFQPRFHCFGHIHASHGQAVKNNSSFVNAALAAGEFPFHILNKPITVLL